jgi:hypothetical protein
MAELASVMSVQDLYAVLEIIAVDDHNRRILDKAAERNQKR